MTSKTCTVALVEDEPLQRSVISLQVSQLGYTVHTFSDATGLYRHMATQTPTIVLLDIGLPGEDGLSICRYLREHNPQIGIVLLTGRSQRDDRLTGLASGADAYLVKPVDMDELSLVLRRLAERIQTPGAGLPSTQDVSKIWHIDAQSQQLISPRQHRVRLTLNEVQVLKPILEKAGAVCPYAELAHALGSETEQTGQHRVEVIISRLRAKVERECGITLPIKSERGVGYVLNQPRD